MEIQKYIQRKQAEKELGKGFYDNTKSNYNYHVNCCVRTIKSMYGLDLHKHQEYVTDLIENARQAKMDIKTAIIGKYLSLGLGGLCLSSINEETFAINATLLGAFGAMAGIMQYLQIKSNRQVKQNKNKIKEAFGLDKLDQGVYSKTTSRESGRRLLPMGAYISDQTCHTCIDDACDQIIEDGIQK